MNSILEKIKHLDPNNSDAVKNEVAKFVQNLHKHTESDCYNWLTTLHFVINRFPKYCMNHRNIIENHIKHFLDCSNLWLVIEAAKCAHQLQQVRPPQEKTATPKTCWFEQIKHLCNSVHKLVQTIFKNSVDMYKHRNEFQEINCDTILSSTVLATALSQINIVKNSKNEKITAEVKQNILCKRLVNLFVFIQAMLVETYPVAKMIHPPLIFSVLQHTLSVSCNKDNLDVTLSKYISSIKVQALKTIDALILCLNARLIEYSPLVFRCIMQTLRWSSEHPNEQSSIVCCQAYNSLSLWLTTLQCIKPNPRSDKDVGKSIEQELIEHIIRDITPAKNVVQLTLSTQPTRKLSKKAKRKLTNSMLHQSAIAEHIPGEKNKTKLSDNANDDVAIAALSFADVFITVSGVFLQKAEYELLLSNFVNECCNIELYSEQRALHLLKALEACRKSTRPDASYAAKYCLPIYSKLKNSPHFEISSLCLRGCLDIKMQFHSTQSPLLFETECKENEVSSEENRRELSERNKRAFEDFIDGDSVSEVDNENEIDVSTQEPQNKKIRSEEPEKDHLSINSKDSVTVLDNKDEDMANDTYEIIVDTPQEQNNTEKDKRKSSEGKSYDESQNHHIDDNSKEQSPVHVSDEHNITKVSSNESLIDTQNTIMVSYGSPENKNKKIPILEKLDGEDVCDSDSEDALLICGQYDLPNRYSEIYVEKRRQLNPVPITVQPTCMEKVTEDKNIEVKVNETEMCTDQNKKSVNISKNGSDMSVEEMMADFVDETIDDEKQNSETK